MLFNLKNETNNWDVTNVSTTFVRSKIGYFHGLQCWMCFDVAFECVFANVNPQRTVKILYLTSIIFLVT